MNLAVTDTQNSRVECTNTQTQKKRISVSLCDSFPLISRSGLRYRFKLSQVEIQEMKDIL